MTDLMATLHDAAKRRDGAGVIAGLRRLAAGHPKDWPDILVDGSEDWGDDRAFVMRHVVLHDENAVTFEVREQS